MVKKSINTSLFLILLLVCIIANASAVEDSIRLLAGKGDNLPYLSKEEKDAIFYTNYVRIAPQHFLNHVLLPYLASAIVDSNYANSLIIQLKKQKPLTVLNYQIDLHAVAKKHAIQSGRSGKVGHYNFDERTRMIAQKYEQIGENLSYGELGGMEIIIRLLIDEDVPDLGHRKNLLNPEFHFIGNSNQYHKKYGKNYVQILAGRKL